MKYVNITGPRADIDRVANTYLARYEIHLENALTELTDVKTLTPFVEDNPYREPLRFLEGLMPDLPGAGTVPSLSMTISDAQELVKKLEDDLGEIDDTRKDLEQKHAALISPLKVIRPFRNIDYDISAILHFEHICYRFGRIDRQFFTKFEQYIYNNINSIFIKADEDDSYVYGVYFSPRSQAEKINAVFSSMHFEEISLPDSYSGTALEACDQLEAAHRQIHREMEENQNARKTLLSDHLQEILSARKVLKAACENFDIRKYAACTKAENTGVSRTGEGGGIFYILCGWMSEKDADELQAATKDDENIYCLIDSKRSQKTETLTPPTKLKNIPLLKPFELYVRMYGLPAYNEMDPTWFLAITYSFIFGAMFGDVGQGLLLFLGGLFLYKKKKMDLAGIISCAGVFSIFFGFMYGSLFGFEDILPALWLKPMTQMMSVPFVGKLNTVFVVAIGFGMLLILVCMIFNIINSWRNKDVEKTWFDSSAVAGLVFYGSVVLSAFLLISGHTLPGGIVLGIMFGIPVIVMFLKEPLTNLVKKKAKIMPDQKAIFFVQSFFEMFEVMLSYLSNTLSFLRIGAFAVSHAAMMEVVLMLSGAENGATGNILVIILGNLFVCGMEGLIVGIQVLRLEYYEIFSRFYKGNGREFKPFKDHSLIK